MPIRSERARAHKRAHDREYRQKPEVAAQRRVYERARYWKGLKPIGKEDWERKRLRQRVWRFHKQNCEAARDMILFAHLDDVALDKQAREQERMEA